MISTKEILEQAQKFYEVAEFCIGIDYKGWYVGKEKLSDEELFKILLPKETITSVVNLAFCTELLLKSIQNKGNEIYGHDLFMLYDGIEDSWKNIIKEKMEVTDNDSFVESLKEVSDVFQKWRYIYESAPQERKVYFTFLKDLTTILMVVAHGKYYYDSGEFTKISLTDLKIIKKYIGEKNPIE